MHGAELLRARGIAGTEEEAEVYLDVSIEVERAKSPESHYATALVTIRGYDSGDGSLLYTAVEPSGPVLSRVSAEDAALNAVRGAVSVALPAAVRGARDAMRPHIQGGVPYRLFLRGDVSPRHRALLQRRLALIDPQVTRREHESESVYSLRYYGFRKDLISELRAIGDWNLRLLETKGNTVTFTKGSD